MSAENQEKYITKDVAINGQIITLYSSNGQTWLSSPEEVEQVMTRLENTRITLAEGKVGDSMTALKPTSPRFRPKLKKYPDAQQMTESNEQLDTLVEETKTMPIPELPAKAPVKAEAKPAQASSAKKAVKAAGKVKAKPAAKKAPVKKAQPKKAKPVAKKKKK